MIVIDASKGGTDEGNKGNGIVEKDFTLLISNYIYDRLKELGADVKLVRTSDETISDSNRAIRVVNAYGDNRNVIAISNILNSGGLNGAEIVYALRNTDNLASKIANSLENAGIKVNKYYQKRSDQDTSKDYYPIQRNTGQIQTIVIDYGYVDNLSDANNLKNNYKKYGEAVVKAIAEYKGLKYYPVDNKYEVYIVQKGDSLYSVAKKNNTTVNEIKKLNNLTSNLLSIGQSLLIPGTNNEENKLYTVQKGDSLYSVAIKNNTTVEEIKKLNNLTSNLLSIGQSLLIPSANNESNKIYTVQKGDSLYSIAIKNNTTVEEIKKLNNLKSNLLSIGQSLLIPGTNSESNKLYTVQKGDSLYSIATKNNTTVDEIKRLNNLTNNLLSIGQQLVV